MEKAAEAVKKKMSEIGPRGPFLLVELYKDAGEYEAALNIVIKLMEQSPKEDIKLINLRGTLLMMLKRFDEARPYLEKAESMAPANMERLSVMADLYLQVNEPDKSSEKFQTLISLRPDQPETKFTAMDALMAHGFAKHAKKLCDATTMPKEIIRHYNNKGVMLTKEGKHDEAIKLYDYALTYFPDYMENYRIMYNIVLAKLHLKEKGYVKECIALLEKCVTMAPDFDKAQKALRTLHDAIKKPKSDDPKGGAAA
jgi:tetratricopeptide (TPR) repeat protein